MVILKLKYEGKSEKHSLHHEQHQYPVVVRNQGHKHGMMCDILYWGSYQRNLHGEPLKAERFQLSETNKKNNWRSEKWNSLKGIKSVYFSREICIQAY
jgi:hypothetical protein